MTEAPDSDSDLNLNLKRRSAVRDLVELRRPVDASLADLAIFGWTSAQEVVMLRLRDVLRALDRFEDGSIGAAELTLWSEALFDREDISLDPLDRDFLADALFQLSTPELFGSMAAISVDLRRRALA